MTNQIKQKVLTNLAHLTYKPNKIECGYCQAEYDANNYDNCPHCGWNNNINNKNKPS